jgi:hypothetical protein
MSASEPIIKVPKSVKKKRENTSESFNNSANNINNSAEMNMNSKFNINISLEEQMPVDKSSSNIVNIPAVNDMIINDPEIEEYMRLKEEYKRVKKELEKDEKNEEKKKLKKKIKKRMKQIKEIKQKEHK